MARSKLYHARICAALILVYFAGLTYWLSNRHSAMARKMLIRTRLRFAMMGTSANSMDTCLEQLLSAFGVEEFNQSVPTYVRLPTPVPISNACSGLLANFTSTPRLTAAEFTKFVNLKPADQEKMHWYVQQLFTNFTQRNLELFLAGGSLLGSVRHHGFFPWDADADVMILMSQKSSVRQLLIDLSASDEYRFVDTEGSNGHWHIGLFCVAIGNQPHRRMYGTERLYPEKECKTKVDFFFGWTERRVHKRLEPPRAFPVGDVYPLVLRPYGPYLLPAPRNPENFLAAVYGKGYESVCHFTDFGSRSFPCETLRSVYPFVAHLRLPYNGRVLRVDLLVQDSSMLSLFIPGVL